MSPEFVSQFQFYDSTRVSCPFCTPDRKHKSSKDMTLTRKDDGAVVYYCHHCYAQGSVQPQTRGIKLSAVPQPSIISNKLESAHYTWLQSRGISPQTADKMKLFAAEKYFHRLNKESPAVGFPYYRNGSIVAAKYRSIEAKDFTQDMGGAHDFFGIELVDPSRPMVIVEGEMDCLTALEVGIDNVVSVPSGAPMKVADGKVLPSEDKKFSFVWNARDILEQVPYVVLATDQDPAGQALAEELARRIGKEKCRLAKFDKKDFNDILMDDDPTREDTPADRIRAIIDEATPYPINGISTAADYADRLNSIFNNGDGRGYSTGYASLDEVYTVAPAQMTVVTGYPSSGKSNFVDQIMVNLAKGSDWKFAICSFENQPETHIARLMEIYTGKRFFEGADRMSVAERNDAFKWVTDHFVFIDHGGEEPSTLESILDRMKVTVKRWGVRGIVIDPYNYIDMSRKEMSETDAISQMLTKVQKFIKTHDLHCWFVAHPAKMNRSGNDQPRPDGMAISGSMAWWAKTDCGITVHRGEGMVVEIAVWKCRYRWVGTQGETTLLYNKVSGAYSEQLDHF